MTDIPIDLPAWVRPPIESHTPPVPRGEPLACPVWHSTLVRLTAEGITVRCKSCRGIVHTISWERVDAIRGELTRGIE